MFAMMWGPTLAALAVVLDHADNPLIVSTALTGLMHAARIAAYHHINEARPRCLHWTGWMAARPAEGPHAGFHRLQL